MTVATENSYAARIRKLLRTHEDGMTVASLCAALNVQGRSRPPIYAALHGMPDAYIDRWQVNPGRGAHRAVWCVVKVPEHCPRPGK